MTYEEFLQLTEKNLKRFFPESFQERKVEIREVLKNNNIKLQGVYLSHIFKLLSVLKLLIIGFQI